MYHRERAREIVWLLAAPSVLETGKLTHGKDYQWLKYIKVLWRDVNTLIARLLLCISAKAGRPGWLRICWCPGCFQAECGHLVSSLPHL